MKTMKFDKIKYGFILGIIAPLIMFFIIYLTKYADLQFADYVQRIIAKNIFTKLISLSALPNLALFFLFLNTNRYRVTQGIIAATFVVAFIMLLIKLIV